MRTSRDDIRVTVGVTRNGLGPLPVCVIAFAACMMGCSGGASPSELPVSAAGAMQTPTPTATAPGPAAMMGATPGSAPAATCNAPSIVTYSEVFKEVVAGCGASFCHGANVGMFHVGNSETETYRQLVNVAAMDANPGAAGKASCAAMGLTRVTPGNPMTSLLYLKLTGTQPCGESMPPSTVGPLLPIDKTELVRRWIECGALPGTTPNDPVAEMDTDMPRDTGVVNTAPPMADWHLFGFDSNNSFYNRAEKKLSPANVGMLAPIWMKPNFGTGMYATPAVVEGVLYYPERDRALVAVNATSGEQIWRKTVGGAVTYGEINSSPLVTDDRVYIGGMGTLFAFDRKTGNPAWNTVLGTHPDQHIYSSPVLADDLVIIGVASHELVNGGPYEAVGSVAAVDKNTGMVRWQFATAGRQVLSNDDMPSGAGASVWSTAAVDTVRKLVFIGVGQSYTAPASRYSDSLLVINYQTGQEAWHHQFTANDVYVVSASCEKACMNDLDVGAAPNLFKIGERDVVGVGSKAGIYKVFDRESGEVIWMRQLTDASPAGGMIASAAVGDGVIYAISNQWDAYQFPTSRGGHNPADVSRVYKLDAATGTPIWETPTQLRAPAVGHLTLANGVLYASVVDGWGFALDAESGKPLWEFDLGHDLACGFSIVDGVLYGGSGGLWMSSNSRPGGSLFAFSAP